MQAIIEVSGQQYQVRTGTYLYVPRIQAEVGTEIRYKEVLLLDKEDGSKPLIGQPYVPSAEVRAEVLEQLRADKCIVFKKKRRKGYQTKNGHRQPYTRLHIHSISKHGT